MRDNLKQKLRQIIREEYKKINEASSVNALFKMMAAAKKEADVASKAYSKIYDRNEDKIFELEQEADRITSDINALNTDMEEDPNFDSESGEGSSFDFNYGEEFNRLFAKLDKINSQISQLRQQIKDAEAKWDAAIKKYNEYSNAAKMAIKKI